ncbi:MAG: hypothetical protein WA875_00230 [Candidatus Acidiferrales bacterium]
MTCPQCSQRVPARRLWTATHLSGVICPHCNASLCPGATCAVVMTILAFGAGELTLLFLHRHGYQVWESIAGFVVVAALVYAVLGPLVIRLHPKDGGTHGMTHHRV